MKHLYALLAAVVLSLALSTAHAEKIDCESMAEIGSGLEDIRDGLAAGEDVDDDTDEALGAVILILRVIAEEEQNARLDRALDQLESAWHDNDRDGFVSAIDDVNTLFLAFYVSDCD